MIKPQDILTTQHGFHSSMIQQPCDLMWSSVITAMLSYGEYYSDALNKNYIEENKNLMRKLEHIGIVLRDQVLVDIDKKKYEEIKLLNDRLIDVMRNLLDATEDKNGQFSSWHKHLRQTTKEARELINGI